MTIEEVRTTCQNIANRTNVMITCPIAANGRLTATLGRVCFKNEHEVEKIEFSKKFLENGTPEAIDDTIRHEMAHYIAFYRSGETHGHDAYWKKICGEVGAIPERCASGNIYVEAKKAYKYNVYCDCCGKEVGHYYRAGKIVSNPEYYHSSCCQSKINVVQNF